MAEGTLLVRGNENLLLPRILIAYGSESGTVEAAATSLDRYFKLVNPSLSILNDVAKLDQAALQGFTLICATFGKGEPPNNAGVSFSKDFTGVFEEGISLLSLHWIPAYIPTTASRERRRWKKLKRRGGAGYNQRMDEPG